MEILTLKYITKQKIIINYSLNGFKCRLETAEVWICVLEVVRREYPE